MGKLWRFEKWGLDFAHHCDSTSLKGVGQHVIIHEIDQHTYKNE